MRRWIDLGLTGGSRAEDSAVRQASCNSSIATLGLKFIEVCILHDDYMKSRSPAKDDPINGNKGTVSPSGQSEAGVWSM